VDALQDHTGSVRAYRLVARDGGGTSKNSPDTKLNKVGNAWASPNELAVGSLEWCKAHFRHQNHPGGERILAVELKSDDITQTDPRLQVSNGKVVEELDLVALGIKKKPTTGLLDCRTDKDVRELAEDHVGTIRAYKHVTKDGDSPTQTTKIRYKIGNVYEEPNADTNRAQDCSHGLNVASLEWVKRGRVKPEGRIFAVEFESTDLACVPTSSDGKFRTRKLTVVEELDPNTDKPLPDDGRDDDDEGASDPKPPKDTLITKIKKKLGGGKKKKSS